MKKRLFLLFLFTVPFFVTAQDKYARIAFVYTSAENKSMFGNDGFTLTEKELEGGGFEQYYMKPGNQNEYQLVYNTRGSVVSLTLYTTEDLYNAFKRECIKNYKEETPEDDDVDAVYRAPTRRYSFSMFMGWLEPGYKIRVESARPL